MLRKQLQSWEVMNKAQLVTKRIGESASKKEKNVLEGSEGGRREEGAGLFI